MLTETGRVIALENDGVWIETIRQSTCGSCAAQKGCGHSLINQMSDGARHYIRALSGKVSVEDCEVDDRVLISIPEEVILRGSFVVYLLPLVTMLIGAAVFAQFQVADADLLAALGAIAGFAIGIAAVRWHAWRHRDDDSFQPTLLEILQSGSLLASTD